MSPNAESEIHWSVWDSGSHPHTGIERPAEQLLLTLLPLHTGVSASTTVPREHYSFYFFIHSESFTICECGCDLCLSCCIWESEDSLKELVLFPPWDPSQGPGTLVSRQQVWGQVPFLLTYFPGPCLLMDLILLAWR